MSSLNNGRARPLGAPDAGGRPSGPSLPEEFSPGAGDWPNELSRRRFLQLMGASIALASTAGCTRNPPEFILPYRKQPEEIIPGRPLFYATALTLGGYARGVLVETHEGRPTKIEGNPLHPASLGSTDVFMQAELLTLYDPERSKAVQVKGQPSTWDVFLGEVAAAAAQWTANAGAGLRLLTQHETSPTLLDQIARLLAKYPAAKWHVYEPLGASACETVCHFDQAEVILSLGADFLALGPASVRYARDFAKGRRPNGTMNRLYVAESTPTLTGSMADHRFALRPDEIEQLARDLLAGGGNSEHAQAIARDLRAHAGKSIVVAGEAESPAVHAAARQLNEALGNVGVTIDYSPPVSSAGSLAELVADLRAGTVETLVVLGGNPAYDAPADFEFARLLGLVSRTIHFGLYDNETAAFCRWHLPAAHELETWSDARAFEGTASIMQPMIEPLFAGRSRHELLSALLEEAPASAYEIVRGYWQTQHPGPDFELAWRKALHDGVVPGVPSTSAAPALPLPAAVANAGGLQLAIRSDARMHDGRYANNAWLQELPHPETKIVWDNAALVSPATAQRFALEQGEVVNLKFRGRSLRAPVWILCGQADDCVTVTLGYGRTRAGTVGDGVGYNAYALRISDAPWGGGGLEIE